MLDSTNVSVYNEGAKFKFNVDAVSGTLHKSTRKSKFCVRKVNDDCYIFDDTHPHLTSQNREEIVVLQTMLTGQDKILVEYMSRKDYDEMFDGPLPEVDVASMLAEIKNKVNDYVSQEEGYERLVDKDKEEGYEDWKWDRRYMADKLTKAVVKNVCEYLESKHIGTFDFNKSEWACQNMIKE